MIIHSRSTLFPAFSLALFIVFAAPGCDLAQTSSTPRQASHTDLTAMKLEDLMNIEVTSVSKKEQKVSQVAASIFVITQEDIQHSGATNIPDLLRMVPGMDVAQINSNSWAVSARGLNGLFSNELLAMVDGRIVYAPSFGGVYWDALDVPLEDIAQIEVIRGPGGTIWDANAVNGVVNIITKKSADTQGAMVTVGGGGIERESATLQYGGALGSSGNYRVYTKYFNDESLESPTGPPLGDGWHTLRAGFRTDSTLSAKDTLTFLGDIYSNRKGEATTYLPNLAAPAPLPLNEQVDFSGGFFQSIWNHAISDGSSTQLSLTFDRYARMNQFGERRNTLQLAFQHNFSWGTRQDIIWGLEYRFSGYDTRGSLLVSLDPASRDYNLYSAFLQDEIALLPSTLHFTVGTRVEQHYYAGFVTLPSARLTWTPNGDNTVWAATSLARRTPSDLDVAIRGNLGGVIGAGGNLTEFEVTGNPNLRTENFVGEELGYRAVLTPRIALDLVSFFNKYDNQETVDSGAPFFTSSPAPPHTVIPFIYGNLIHGETHGFEVFSDWRLTSHWTLSPGYAFEGIHMHREIGTQDVADVYEAEGSTPVHSAQLRSHYALPHSLSWDLSAYYVGRLSDPVVSSYTRRDSQLSWQCNEQNTFSVVGQNLLRDDHLEFVDDTGAARSALVQRSAFAKLTWRF